MITNKWTVLLVTTGSQTGTAIIAQGVAVLSPFLILALSLSKVQMGIIAGAINVGMAFTFILFGQLVDRWGGRIVLITGGILLGIEIILASLANSFLALLVLLLAAGFFAASSTPAGSKAIIEWFPLNLRGFALGVRQTGVALGGFIAALILPNIAIKTNWKSAFIVAGIIAILVSTLSAFAWREKSNVRIGNTERSKIKTIELLLNRNILLTSLTGITYVGAQFVLVTYLDLYLVEEIGISLPLVSTFIAIALLGGVVGRPTWGFLSDYFFRGIRKPVILGVGLLTIAMSLIMLLIRPSTPYWLIGIISWLFGFSALGWNGVQITLISELAEREYAGTVVGIGVAIAQFGVLTIPPLFGYLIDSTGSYYYSWIVLALVVLLGVISIYFVTEKKLLKEKEHFQIHV